MLDYQPLIFEHVCHDALQVGPPTPYIHHTSRRWRGREGVYADMVVCFWLVKYLEQQVDAFRELLRAREKMVKVRPIILLPPFNRSLIYLPTALGTSLVDPR